jgi:hypothetical protein
MVTRAHLEPVSALASLGLVLEDPKPLHVRVLLVADAAHHPVRVHGVHDVGVLLGALPALAGLQEKGVLKRKKSCCPFSYANFFLNIYYTLLPFYNSFGLKFH